MLQLTPILPKLNNNLHFIDNWNIPDPEAMNRENARWYELERLKP